jgi:hypothetical protein
MPSRAGPGRGPAPHAVPLSHPTADRRTSWALRRAPARAAPPIAAAEADRAGESSQLRLLQVRDRSSGARSRRDHSGGAGPGLAGGRRPGPGRAGSEVSRVSDRIRRSRGGFRKTPSATSSTAARSSGGALAPGGRSRVPCTRPARALLAVRRAEPVGVHSGRPAGGHSSSAAGVSAGGSGGARRRHSRVNSTDRSLRPGRTIHRARSVRSRLSE